MTDFNVTDIINQHFQEAVASVIEVIIDPVVIGSVSALMVIGIAMWVGTKLNRRHFER